MLKNKNNLQKGQSRFCKMSIIAFVLAITSILIAIGCFVVDYTALFFLIPIIVLTLIFGIVGLFIIKHSKRALKGKALSISGLLISVILPIMVLYGAVKLKGDIGRTLSKVLCQERLYGLWQCIIHYSEDNNGQYPSADKWCDLLKEKDCPQIYFTCPAGKGGLCSYAMNPRVEPNSPHDVVLLFESKHGWNQFGGSDLFNPGNHKEKGANILFNGGYVKFIELQGLEKLKWGRDEK